YRHHKKWPPAELVAILRSLPALALYLQQQSALLHLFALPVLALQAALRLSLPALGSLQMQLTLFFLVNKLQNNGMHHLTHFVNFHIAVIVSTTVSEHHR